MLDKGHLIVALVPARGGSKQIKKKNLALVNGRPLVWHTLSAALSTPLISGVWLSSDDAEILAIGRQAGASALERPVELANDHASPAVVVQHFLDALPAAIKHQDPVVVYLQPTSPLRTARHIQEALELMHREKAPSVMSVVPQQQSPFKSFTLDGQGRLRSLFDEKLSNSRRQDLPQTYLPNGAIYGFLASEFMNRGGFPSNGAAAYIMSAEDSVDVDDQKDLERVQAIIGTAYA